MKLTRPRKIKAPPEASPDYYPIFLDLKGKQCVVIGGGKVAERKVLSLLRAGARVTVISPELTEGLNSGRSKKAFLHVAREFRRSDLKEAFLVIAATSNDLINIKISEEALLLVSIASEPEKGNFISPAFLQKGSLAIAVSTGGASPAMASAIKKELDALYSKEFVSYLLFLENLRRDIKKKIPDQETRKRLFREAASDKMLGIVRKEGIRSAKKTVLENLAKYQKQPCSKKHTKSQ
jgi:precorrin-2 dehydrogenase / sirohydrochlorin ferrochelatase